MCSCLALCSLAEDEVKTEADVVEGMDASVRSKGKSLRPSSSRYEPNICVVLVSENVEVNDCEVKKKRSLMGFCWSLRIEKIICHVWLLASTHGLVRLKRSL